MDTSLHGFDAQKPAPKKPVRISYRFYKTSRPELFAERHPMAPYEDYLLADHATCSPHHPFLSQFDDLHSRGLEERE